VWKINENKTIERCNIRRVNERSNGRWDLASTELTIMKRGNYLHLYLRWKPIFILIYSCPDCMLHLGFATHDSANFHQLSTCVTSCMVDCMAWPILRAVYQTSPLNYPCNIKGGE